MTTDLRLLQNLALYSRRVPRVISCSSALNMSEQSPDADENTLDLSDSGVTRFASNEQLARFASKILSDQDAGRLSQSMSMSVLRHFFSGESESKYVSFLNEVSLMNRLRHPNLVLYMGAVVDPNHPLCIVSELFDGGSLHSYLHSDPAFCPDTVVAVRIAIAIARGMLYLHNRSAAPFLHRDLKPRNVLLKSVISDDPHVVICDFGLCKLFAGDSDSSHKPNDPCAATFAGTVSYMSPNVIEGGTFTTSDDVYSFGILLWELFTGRVPYAGMRPIQVMFNVADEGMRPGFEDSDNVPPAARAIISDCWHETRFRRPTFETVTQRLNKLLEDVLASNAASAD